jgi:hypothetical protein
MVKDNSRTDLFKPYNWGQFNSSHKLAKMTYLSIFGSVWLFLTTYIVNHFESCLYEYYIQAGGNPEFTTTAPAL